MRWLVGGGVALCAALLIWLWVASGEDKAAPSETPEAAPATKTTADTTTRTRPSLKRATPPAPAAARPKRTAMPTDGKYSHPATLAPMQTGDDDPRARPRVSLTINRRARVALEDGKYDLALRYAEDDLASNPNARRSRVIGIVAACGLGDSAKAEALAAELPEGPYARVSRRCRSEFAVELPPRPPDEE